MTRFALPTTGAKNVQMDNGHKYVGRGTIKRGRVIEVKDTKDAKAIGAQDHIQRIADFAGAGIPGESRVCRPCNFTGFKWQQNCPRCGREMETL